MTSRIKLQDDHPIFVACRKGNLTLVEKFLNEGVSVYADSEHNPAIFGIAVHHEQKAIVEVMIKHGLDIKTPCDKHGTSLALLPIKKQNIEWLEYLLDKGIPIETKNNFGSTLLSLAAAGGKVKSLQYLLQKGASPLEADLNGNSPFRQAARNNQISAMELLHEAGANIDEVDLTKTTPLIGCAKGDKPEAMKWLLEHGSDINAVDERGKTALDWAKANGHTKVVDLHRPGRVASAHRCRQSRPAPKRRVRLPRAVGRGAFVRFPRGHLRRRIGSGMGGVSASRTVIPLTRSTQRPDRPRRAARPRRAGISRARQNQ
jgi:ankyrin repeat protein